MKKLNLSLLAGLMALACTICNAQETADYQVVPLPQEVTLTQQKPFILNENVAIVYPNGNTLLKRDAEFLSEYLKESIGYALKVRPATGKPTTMKSIILALDPTVSNKEGYTLAVNSEEVQLKGQTANGIFYAIQTLRKAIPAKVEDAEVILPAVLIKDEPRFEYRGMHLDVGRHFFPVQFIKKYIDLLALHNMNTFHWHLTEDQGWRIEIKKYPKLTQIGSIRQQTVIGKNTQEYDHTQYGGFYTQKEAREIVRYAQERYITVIPEIDMPGHMLAALAAYPELGCTGGPYEVATRWGIFNDVLCIGNPKSIQFLKDVLTEIMDIFPSKYIHIGGDEAPRTRWKTCRKCQALIKKEGLKTDEKHTAEDRLQSYCMATIEKFLNSKGRKIIGWDEILEGDVAPNATVMSWRGMDGGIKAAQMGHDVIMTPTTYAYFDYYQTDDIQDEPLAIGGYLPVEKVYGMKPVPASLTPEQQKHILGVQANVWTEYIPTTGQVEYMILPRMAALAEVQWTQPEKKDYKDFTRRLVRLMKFYDRDGFNSARHLFNIKADFTANPQERAEIVTLSTIDNAPIYYTLDGKEPDATSTRYTDPIAITGTVDFRAVAIRAQKRTKEIKKEVFFNKATFCPIKLTNQPSDKYRSKGAITLVDGIKGNISYATGDWLGFVNNDPEVVIDLGANTEISQVNTDAVVDMSAWIMGSTGLTVAISDDNKTFQEIAHKTIPAETDINKKEVEHYELSFDPVKTRYVKITIERSPALPKGHDGEGKRPYLFIDEIGIN